MKEVLFTSSVLILALLVLRRLFRDKISRCVQYALWGLVLVRLLVPVSLPGVDFSVLTAVEPVAGNIEALYTGVYSDAVTKPDNSPYPGPGFPWTNPPRVTVGPVSEDNVQVYTDRYDAIHETVYQQQIRLDDLLRPVWYGGMVLMACWLVLSNILFWRKLCKARTPYMVEGCKYPVYLIENGLPSPCLFGLFRPAVYLTPAALASPDALRHVLAHEETHARHLDPLWALLRGVCLAVYWFDPLVWWAAVVSRTDCELACDEGALRRLGEDERIPYGRTLLSLIPVRRTPVNPLLSATTMTAGKRQLKDRITRIAENRKMVRGALFAVVLIAALVCAVTFTGAKTNEMTDEEILELMHQFDEPDEDGFRAASLNGILFDRPEDIDLYQLFCFSIAKSEGYFDEEYKQVVEKLDGEDPHLPLIKVSAGTIDAFLAKYTGTSRADNPESLNQFVYLPEYDAYYAFPDPNGSHTYLMSYCTGQRDGDFVHIRYEGFVTVNNDELYGKFCLTLKKQPGGGYWFVSNIMEESTGQNNNRSLTTNELAYFNGKFFTEPTGQDGRNLRAQFLTSIYDNPDEIDLYELLYNGTGYPETITEEERQRVVNLSCGGVDPGVDLTKISYDHMMQFLKDNTGVTGGNPHAGLEKLTWLGEHSAYYHFHGDTNAAQPTFTSGTRDGDLIHLYYEGTALSDAPFCLTLRKSPGGRYWFVSNLPTGGLPTVYPSWEPELVIPLDNAQPYTAPVVEQKAYGGTYTEMLDGERIGVGIYVLCAMRTEHGNVHFGVQSMLLSSWPSTYFLAASNDTYSIEHFSGLFGHDGLAITYETSGTTFGDTFTDYYYFQEDGTPVLLVRIENPYMPTSINLDGNGEKELVSGAGDDCTIFFQRDGQIYRADLITPVSDAWKDAQYIHFGSLDASARCVSLYGEVPFEGTHNPTGTLHGTAFRYLYFDGENLRLYKDQRLYPNHFSETIDAAEDVRKTAERVVSEKISESSEGWRLVDGEFVTMPLNYDNWRVSLLEGPYTETLCGQTFQVWRLDYQLHTDTPEYVILAGGRYVTEDGWVSPGYPGCDWLLFLLNEDGSWDYLYCTMENDCDPDSDIFWLDQFSALEERGLVSLNQLDESMLLHFFAIQPATFLNNLAERPEAQRETILQTLGQYLAIVSGNPKSADNEQWEGIIDYLRVFNQDVTQEGKGLWNQLNEIIVQNYPEQGEQSPDAPADAG